MQALSDEYLRRFRAFDGHRSVVEIEDQASGLHGYIAIHNDTVGPAVGGTRMFPYASKKDALEDVLRLSRSMTYKCAIAGLRYGGGKGVIIGHPETDKTEALLHAYAQAVKELHGGFFTGEDVGLAEADVQCMLHDAPYFIGKTGQAGDPSPFAALSTFYAIEVVVKKKFNRGLRGLSVAIKGVGKVGSKLAALLKEAGANVVIADINPKAIEQVTAFFPGVRIVDPLDIHRQEVDVYAPCALGNEFTSENMKEIKAKIICGGANNQLANDETGDWIFSHGILYVPDYVANAGGLIDVVDELEPGGFQKSRVMERIERMKQTIGEILTMAEERNVSPHRVADQIAEQRFNGHVVVGAKVDGRAPYV